MFFEFISCNDVMAELIIIMNITRLDLTLTAPIEKTLFLFDLNMKNWATKYGGAANPL